METQIELLKDAVSVPCIREQLSAKGVIFVRLTGTSMGPFVKNGALTLLKKVAPCDIRVGDVILYCIGEELFAHRVFKTGKSFENSNGRMPYAPTLALKADAVARIDRNVSFEEVIGKVTCIKRGNCVWKDHSVINYFILFYSFMLSVLREKVKKVMVMKPVWKLG